MNLSQYAQEILNSVVDFLPRLALAIIILIIGAIIARQLGRILYKRLAMYSKDVLTVSFLSRLASWLVMLFVIILAMNILGLGGFANSLVAGAGISALVIGFALKDIGENLLSGIALSIKPPFTIGDIIESNGIKGEVKIIDIRTTHILTTDGKDVLVPNSLILKSTLTILTKRHAIRQELAVAINNPKDLDQATEIINQELANIKGIVQKPEWNIIIDDYSADKVKLLIYYWIDYSDKSNVMEVTNQVIKRIKSALISAKLS